MRTKMMVFVRKMRRHWGEGNILKEWLLTMIFSIAALQNKKKIFNYGFLDSPAKFTFVVRDDRSFGEYCLSTQYVIGISRK